MVGQGHDLGPVHRPQSEPLELVAEHPGSDLDGQRHPVDAALLEPLTRPARARVVATDLDGAGTHAIELVGEVVVLGHAWAQPGLDLQRLRPGDVAPVEHIAGVLLERSPIFRGEQHRRGQVGLGRHHVALPFAVHGQQIVTWGPGRLRQVDELGGELRQTFATRHPVPEDILGKGLAHRLVQEGPGHDPHGLVVDRCVVANGSPRIEHHLERVRTARLELPPIGDLGLSHVAVLLARRGPRLATGSEPCTSALIPELVEQLGDRSDRRAEQARVHHEHRHQHRRHFECVSRFAPPGDGGLQGVEFGPAVSQVISGLDQEHVACSSKYHQPGSADPAQPAVGADERPVLVGRRVV